MVELKKDKAYAVIGKAGYGKSAWIRTHIAQLPPESLYILDFNNYDYASFREKSHVWNVEQGTPQECANFIDICYSKQKLDQNGEPTGEVIQDWTFVVLEECDNYLNKDLPAITRFVNTARNRDIGFMCSMKRPKAVKPIYRTRFDYIVLFKQTSPDDIEYEEDWLGVASEKGLRRGDEKDIRRLQVGEFLFCDVNEGTIEGPLKLPKTELVM
jgi:hypothetical protein